MKKLIYNCLLCLLFAAACTTQPQDFNYRHRVDISIENPESETEFFIMKTANNTSANFIVLDFSSFPPKIADEQFWREEGILLDHFMREANNSQLVFGHDTQKYFVHIYDKKGRKAVKQINQSEYADYIQTRVSLNYLGHIACRVYRPFIDSDIDSNLVALFDSTQQTFEILDKVYFEDVELEPLYTTFSGSFGYKKYYYTQYRNKANAFFFNVPVGSYYGISFSKFYQYRGEKNRTLQKVEAPLNGFHFYQMYI
ncbi:hypothetical protein GC194_12845 [bacterium]|nr:hypothetical protein [bacterium]